MKNKGIYYKILLTLTFIGLIFFVLLSSLFLYKQKEGKIIFEESKNHYSNEIQTLISISGREIIQTVYDYTYWDEFVEYVLKNDQDWFDNNIATVIAAFNADYVCVYDTTFQILYESSADSFSHRNFIPDEAIIKLKEVKLLNFYNTVSDTIIEISGGSIHPTNDPTRTLTKPSGYFLIARSFNKHVIDDLSDILGTNTEIIGVNDSVYNSDRFTLVSTQILNDWNGKPITKVVFKKKYDSLKLYTDISRNMFIILLASLVITWFIFHFSFRIWIMRPLKLVLNILKTDDPQLIKELQGKSVEFEKLGILFEQNILQKNELRIAKEKAEESDRLKSAFLANISHEIRTPMNGVLGFTSLLKDPSISASERQEFINLIEQSGERMLNLINDIMDISKIESGEMKLLITKTNIHEQLEYIHSFFKPESEQKGLIINLINNTSNPFYIHSDKDKIYAILSNLVKNAIKFTMVGTIEFGYEKKDKYLNFFVRDTGIGIHPTNQQLIFERFRQGNEVLKHRYEGTGLGLSISKAYVEMLGGRIWFESKLGKGSVFYFTIPLNSKSN